MSPRDARLTLARTDCASQALEGMLSARRYLAPEPMQAVLPLAALRRDPAPAAEQLDQLLFGERFDVLERRGDWGFGQALRDGYVGWVELASVAPADEPPTHWVSALRTYVFSEPSIKAAPTAQLSMNALAHVDGREGRFLHLRGLALSSRSICGRSEAGATIQRRWRSAILARRIYGAVAVRWGWTVRAWCSRPSTPSAWRFRATATSWRCLVRRRIRWTVCDEATSYSGPAMSG